MAQDSVTIQQGIYMENGSGGFLTNLTFVGGNFGAYFGNQQFTTNQLTFMNCKTAVQVHWDWAWTMQDILINNCTNGIVIVSGAGGSGSTGQSVGSLIVLDSIIALCDVGIVTSLFTENSTLFLLQNTRFVLVDGFGRVALASDSSTFYNGDEIPVFGTPTALVNNLKQFYQQRRPTYTDIGISQVIDVKAWGAAGDGETDDGPILNSILDCAANISAIVFFPFGSYVVKDTLLIPVGSRIVGQVWSQIMGKGPKFQKALEPRVVAQVGQPGDVGIIEIQSMMFTVLGPTAGAVLMEWNVYESTQGLAAMWNSHFQVGGAIGSLLRSIQCPKNNGTVNTKCKAVLLLLHLTPKSSAYLENIWAWTADYNLDKKSQDQINIYSARGILIESQVPTWIYGILSEHNVLYQYQISSAKNLYISMIQTESPYYQPVPKALQLFTTGLFPNNPVFT
ncbi:pectin lyase fold/virulence factor [Aspergillus granulosus]|uniref:Pectin lyase fold/virulence factor n=1 Tax=Aspergillus granulosus TaxID=176169 RepID=A0ABR4GX91_9EURO